MSIFICMRAFNSFTPSATHTHQLRKIHKNENKFSCFVCARQMGKESQRANRKFKHPKAREEMREIGSEDEWKKSGACTLEYRLIAVNLGFLLLLWPLPLLFAFVAK